MATGYSGNKESVSITSDIFYDYTCSSCTEDGRNSEATHYCTQCEKLFCDSCIALHSKILRNHTVLGEQAKSLWTVERMPSCLESCERHAGKELEMFCSDHDKVCCTICVSVEHRSCKVVQHLPEVAKGIRQTAGFQLLKSTITVRLEKLNQIIQDKASTVSNLQDKINEIQNTLRAFREQLDKILDELEKETAKKLEEINKTFQDKLKADTDKCKNVSEEVDTLLKAMNEDDKSSEINAFIAFKKGQEKLAETDDLLDSLVKEDVRVTFEPETDLETYLSSFKTLGQFVTSLSESTGPTNCVYQVKGKQKCLINAGSDRKSNEIWGSCQLSNGTFVVVDSSNQKVKLLKKDFSMVSSLEMSPMFPNDVCHTNDTEIAVSSGGGPDRHEIWLISVKNGLFHLTDVLKLDHVCGGVTYRNDRFYISSKNTLYIYTKTGKLIKRLYEDTSETNTIFHFAISNDGRKFYITNMDKHQLITLDACGNKLATLSDPKLKRPTGVCVGGKGTVFVACYDSATVMQVDNTGKHKLAVLLTHADGIYAPYSLTFINRSQQLIVGQASKNILVFDLE